MYIYINSIFFTQKINWNSLLQNYNVIFENINLGSVHNQHNIRIYVVEIKITKKRYLKSISDIINYRFNFILLTYCKFWQILIAFFSLGT